MTVFDPDERRARLVQRHHLHRTGSGFASVADDLVGYHSSDPATVYLAAWSRIPGITSDDVASSLYDDREVMRLYGMRKTLFVVTLEVAPVMNAACARKAAVAERKRLIKLIEEQGIAADGDAWIAAVSADVASALRGRSATATELREEIPEMRCTVTIGPGTYGISTRILFLMGIEGVVVRGKPRGSLVSSQYEWSRIDEWTGEPLADVDVHAAQAELLRRWLRTFGPATELDMQWWAGWTKGDTRRAMEAVGVERVELDGADGFILPGDDATSPGVGRSVALLPSLDPTIMGWKERDWYLGGHTEALFDRNLNAGPTVWADGRVVGGWAHRADGEVAVEFLEPVDTEVEDRVHAEAVSLQEWLGDVRVRARFPTPIDRRLSAV